MYGDTKTGDAKYPMTPVKHDLIVGGPSARRRDAPDATGRLKIISNYISTAG